MRQDTKNALGLAGFLTATLGSGLVIAWLTSAGPGDWYHSLNMPIFIPPAWIFPVVWTVLYIFMGVASWLIWLQRPAPGVKLALLFFFVQLALNMLWSPLFFGLHNFALATVDVGLLLLAILVTCRLFFGLSGPAGWLMLPYFCWVGFAGMLTMFVWRLNS